MTIGHAVRAFIDRRAQPGSPHDSSLEGDLAKQTKIISYRSSGTTHGWAWPGGKWNSTGQFPTGGHLGPYATVAAVKTWTTFDLALAPFQLPWRFTEQYESIMVVINFITHHKASYAWRVRTDDHNGTGDAIATTDGKPVLRALTPTEPDVSWWQQASSTVDFFSLSSVRLKITNPIVPANRRCVLIPEVLIGSEIETRQKIGGDVFVFLYSMHAYELPEYTEGY